MATQLETEQAFGTRGGGEEAACAAAAAAVLPVETAAFVRPLFARLNARGVGYVVLRNYEGYPHALHKADMSLLASDRDVRGVVAAFEEVCAELGCECLVHPGKKQNVVLLALWMDVDGAGEPRVRQMKVDVRLYESFKLTAVQKAGVGVNYKVFFDQVARRRVSQDGCEFYALERTDELIFLMKQWKRKGTAEYRRRVVEALSEPAVAAFARSAGWAVVDAAAEVPAAYEERLDGVVWKLVRRRWGAHTPWRLVRAHVRAARVWAGRWSPGAMVYYAGPDGCGKTTAVDAVKELLRGKGISYKYIYSFKRVLRFFAKHARRVVAGAKVRRAAGRPAAASEVQAALIRSEHADRDTGSPLWRMRKRVTLLVGLTDILMGYALAIPYRLRGHVVLVETSPYDVFIKYHMPEFPVIEAVFAPLLPKPTRCVVLRATSESIYARKPELEREEIDEYYRRLDTILRRARLGGRAVDARSDVGRGPSVVEIWKQSLGVIVRK